MTRTAFEKIKAGLDDALAYAQGDSSRGVAHRVPVRPVAVKAAREKLGLSQEEFARTFGITLATLRHWEQGRRQPSGAARALLVVIDREPRAVQRALKGAGETAS